MFEDKHPLEESEKPKHKGNPKVFFKKGNILWKKGVVVKHRKKDLSSDKSDALRLTFQREIAKDWKKLIRGKKEMALGHWILGKEGRIYKVSPDAASARYLIDQVIGKPMERQKVEAEVNIEMDI